MSGLLKNQLLKQLSKFTKNMSADQINLSAMKGEGDLMNLELDEIVLMNILDMPPWIRIYRAFCNKMTIKIQWMKLNTQPIVLHLDEVTVDMETCYYQPPSSSSSSSSSSRTSSKSAFGTGKYGYIEQVLDGISVSINAININFKSLSFQASFQMSQVAVDSCTPAWRSASLDHTRIKNQSEGSILIFKQVQWQAVRIEANALAAWIATTPLRLIANQSKIRVTLKKNLSDSSVLTSRIELHTDDLLWVVTDSQLFAALSFVQDLVNIINTHPQLLLKDANPKPNQQQQRRKPQPQKQQTEQHFHRKGEQYEELARQQQQQHASLMLFNKFNISESSCHLIINRSEVHLSDDAHQENEGYRSHVEGGAMQLVITQLEFSYYPWRRAGTSRSGWLHFNECSREAEMWFNKFLQIDGKLSTCVPPPVNDPPRGAALVMEECVVVSLEDFCLYRVSTQHDKSRSKPKKFFSSDKKRLILPQDMSTLHVDVTNYTGVEPSSELSSSMFITINPVCLSVDYLSLVWLHTFILNVMKKAENLPKLESKKSSGARVRLKAVMPRICLPSSTSAGYHGDASLLQLQTSCLLLTNAHVDCDAKHAAMYENSHFYKQEPLEPSSSSSPSLPLIMPACYRAEKLTKDEGQCSHWLITCHPLWSDILLHNKQQHQQQHQQQQRAREHQRRQQQQQQNYHSNDSNGKNDAKGDKMDDSRKDRTHRPLKVEAFVQSFSLTLWFTFHHAKCVTSSPLPTWPSSDPGTDLTVHGSLLMYATRKIKAVVDVQHLKFLVNVLQATSQCWQEMMDNQSDLKANLASEIDSGDAPELMKCTIQSLILIPDIEVNLLSSSSYCYPISSSSSSSSSVLKSPVTPLDNKSHDEHFRSRADDNSSCHTSGKSSGNMSHKKDGLSEADVLSGTALSSPTRLRGSYSSIEMSNCSVTLESTNQRLPFKVVDNHSPIKLLNQIKHNSASSLLSFAKMMKVDDHFGEQHPNELELNVGENDEEEKAMMMMVESESPAFVRKKVWNDDEEEEDESDAVTEASSLTSSCPVKKLVSVSTITLQTSELLVNLMIESPARLFLSPNINATAVHSEVLARVTDVKSNFFHNVSHEQFKNDFSSTDDNSKSSPYSKSSPHSKQRSDCCVKVHMHCKHSNVGCAGHVDIQVAQLVLKMRQDFLSKLVEALSGEAAENHSESDARVKTEEESRENFNSKECHDLENGFKVRATLDDFCLNIASNEGDQAVWLERIVVSRNKSGNVVVSGGAGARCDGMHAARNIDENFNFGDISHESKGASNKEKDCSFVKLLNTVKRIEKENQLKDEIIDKLTVERNSLINLLEKLQTDLNISEHLRTKHHSE